MIETMRRSPGRRAASARPGLFLVALAFALVVSVDAHGARAQAGERIGSYDVDIVIEADGALRITEVIAYDFGSNERHGIIREIPVRLRYDGTHDRVYRLDVLDVTATGGAPDQYETEVSNGVARIRIGDPDRTITGAHTYTIRYRIRGALNGFSDHDELYWNAIGPFWDAPIARASARVVAPAAPGEVTCYAGDAGSTRRCARFAIENGAAVFETASLDPRQAFTVVVALPKGTVPEPAPLLEERWSLRRAFTINPLTVGLTALVAAGVGYGLWRLFWTTGRDLRWAGSPVQAVFGPPGTPETVVELGDGGPYPAEYVPPEGVRPGLVGTIFDETAHPLDVTATIVDLAVRGYLRIEEIPKEGWFGKPDWRLVRLEEPDGGLLEYERLLFDGLFEDGDVVLLSSLKNKFAARLREVQRALYDESMRRGWFSERPDSIRTRWLVIGVVAVAAAGAIEFLTAVATTFALAPLPLVLGALVLLVMHRSMPRRTAAGTAVLRRVRGFRRFIADAEDERARFAEQAHLFYDYLPYAIVFGLTERWARAFEGLAADPREAGGWYVASRPFAIADFTDSMDSFAVTSSGTISSTPGGSGSSGFGGGGSAGGGGGGGGGGSW